MKILILLRIFWTAGAQKIAIKEAKELQSLGNKVEIIFLRGKKLPEYSEMLEGINYTIISETGDSFFSPLYQYITQKFMSDRGIESRVDYNLIRGLPKYIKSRKADYIICHDQFAGLAGYYCFKKLGVKYSVFIHEQLFFNYNSILGKLWYNYEHRILKNATKVFAVTEKVAKTIEKKHHIKSDINYPGMDLQRVTEFSKKENALIAVSMWDYGRKPELYLDIIENIDNFILYFVGNFRIKKLEQTFEDSVIRRKLEKKVIMKQGITESELLDLYQKCKFAIRFGFGEYGPSMAVIEAIQNCIPLIINSDLGTAELIEKYHSGLVLTDINYENIERFLNQYNKEDLYKSLQQNVIKCSNDYSWKKHTEKLLIDTKY